VREVAAFGAGAAAGRCESAQNHPIVIGRIRYRRIQRVINVLVDARNAIKVDALKGNVESLTMRFFFFRLLEQVT
jgi:hypothetical protein